MKILDSMIGLVAPPVCIGCGLEGQSLCRMCIETEILPFGSKCWHCGQISKNAAACVSARRNGSPSYVWVVTDYEATAKKLVQAYKFSHQRSAAASMAGTMAQTFFEFNSDSDINKKDFLIVPLATATGRIRQRSFDHTALLAKELSYKLKLPTRKYISRLGQSRQVGSKKSERLAQLEASFYISQPTKIAGRNVLLVDDVITTGGSIIAAAKILKAAGAKSISALVFAKKL